MPGEATNQFAKQIADCHGIIAKICRMYGTDAEDRNDLRQDILLNAWHSYPQFRNESKFSTWLYKVALNTSIGRLRKKRVELHPLKPLHHELPACENEKQSRMELLDNLIRQLTDQEKVLVALYLDELSYAEMADITGLTESNVGVRLNRIKQKLKNMGKHED